MTCPDLFLPYPTFLSVGTRRKINLCQKIAHCEKKLILNFCVKVFFFCHWKNSSTVQRCYHFKSARTSDPVIFRIWPKDPDPAKKIRIHPKRAGSDGSATIRSSLPKSRYLYLFFYFPIFVRVPSLAWTMPATVSHGACSELPSSAWLR